MKRSTSQDQAADQQQSPGLTGKGMARRTLLAAGSLPIAATLTAGAASASADSTATSSRQSTLATPVSGCTLAELRALTTGVSPGTVFYVTDPGREGHFRYESTDTTTVDNDGSVIVSSAGLRFKRIYQGSLSVKWFGARGDGITDDTAAIQKAINAAQAEAAVLYFPTSRPYMISATLTINSSKGGLRIIGDTRRSVGAGRYSTIKVADSVSTSAPLAHIFKFSDSQENTRYEFSDLCIDGSLRARYGIYSTSLTHSIFTRIWINQTLTAALGIGYGWCNDIIECELSLNKGDGIVFTGPSVNALNVINTKIFFNDGIGINMAHPTLSARVQGCTIEQNKKCGVYVQQGATTLSVLNCYIEANAETGLTLGGRTAKAHIIVNGNPDTVNPYAVSNASPNGDIVVANNLVASFYDDTFIEAYSVEHALTMHDNVINRYDSLRSDVNAPYVALRIGTNLTGGGAQLAGVNLKDNSIKMIETKVPTSQLAILDTVGARTGYHHFDVRYVHRVNYSPGIQTFQVVQAASVPGTFTPSATRYRMHQAVSLSGSTNSSIWGFQVDAANYPELAGKYVYFGLSVKQSAGGMRVVLLSTKSGTDTQPVSADTGWREVSQVTLFPATGLVSFGIGMSSDNPAKSLLVACPVLAEVGAPYASVQ